EAAGRRDHRGQRPVPGRPPGGRGGTVRPGQRPGRKRRLPAGRRRHSVLMAARMAKQDTRTRKRPSAKDLQTRRRNCYFCREKIEDVDYKNIGLLRRFVSEKGKIRSRRITGACRRHQNQISVAVTRAREMALMPYVSDR